MRRFFTLTLAALMAFTAVTANGVSSAGSLTCTNDGSSTHGTPPLLLNHDQLTQCVTQILGGAKTCKISLLNGLLPGSLEPAGGLLSLDGHILDLNTLTGLVNHAVYSLTKDGTFKNAKDCQAGSVLKVVQDILGVTTKIDVPGTVKGAPGTKKGLTEGRKRQVLHYLARVLHRNSIDSLSVFYQKFRLKMSRDKSLRQFKNLKTVPTGNHKERICGIIEELLHIKGSWSSDILILLATNEVSVLTKQLELEAKDRDTGDEEEGDDESDKDQDEKDDEEDEEEDDDEKDDDEKDEDEKDEKDEDEKNEKDEKEDDDQ